jgi:hypothetical protein
MIELLADIFTVAAIIVGLLIAGLAAGLDQHAP